MFNGNNKIGVLYATYYVYIMTNSGNKVLYTGVTNDLVKRCIEHRTKEHEHSFTARYNLNKLVYYEAYNDINVAIGREKQIKAGSRRKKIELIMKENSMWLDLFETSIGIDYI